MSDNYIWQPVAYGTLVFRDGELGGFDRIVTPTDEGLVVESYDGVYITDIVLPDDLRLCRRVPTSAQSVPVDASVRKAIEIVIGRSEEAGPYQQTRRTLLDACARIEDWLAGLPEQEAGHD